MIYCLDANIFIEAKNATAEDKEITANNLKYFGEPVYEYTLI